MIPDDTPVRGAATAQLSGTEPLAESVPLPARGTQFPELLPFAAATLWKEGSTSPFPISPLTLLGELPGERAPLSGLTRTGPIEGVEVGSRLVFPASRDDVGVELFVTDGTVPGTTLFADLSLGFREVPGFPGPIPRQSHPALLTRFDDRLSLAAFAPEGAFERSEKDLWSVALDGTGAAPVAGLPDPETQGGPTALLATPERLFVQLDDGSLWSVRRGSNAATPAFVADAPPTTPETIALLGQATEFRGRLAIERQLSSDFDDVIEPVRRELWLTDGHEPLLLSSVVEPTGSDPWQLTQLGDLLFFTPWTSELGRELWVTDGTPRAPARWPTSSRARSTPNRTTCEPSTAGS